jgi:hypothetical protein
MARRSSLYQVPPFTAARNDSEKSHARLSLCRCPLRNGSYSSANVGSLDTPTRSRLDGFTYQASRGRDPERHHFATDRRPALVPANLVWGVFCQGVSAEHSIFFSRGPACAGAVKAWRSPPSARCLAWASELDTSKIVAWPRYRFALKLPRGR